MQIPRCYNKKGEYENTSLNILVFIMFRNKSIFAIIFAGILWGIISVFIKKLSSFGFDSMQIAFLRMAFSAPIFSVVMLIHNPSFFKINFKDIWMFIGTGIISIVLFNFLYFYAMIHSQASIAVVLLYTSPVFVMLLSSVIFKEKVTLNKVISLVLTFAGCVFVTGVFSGSYSVTPIVIVSGLGSGLFYALYTIFGRFALNKYNSMTVTAYTFIFGLIGSIPFAGINKTVNVIFRNPEIVVWCIGIAVLCTVLPYFLYTWGLERMESGKAAILVAVEPLVGALVGMLFFGESRDLIKIIGIIFIFISIFVLNTNFSKNKN